MLVAPVRYELYEKLRDEGNSKQKSARIANAAAASSREEVGRRGGQSPSCEEWNKGELIDALRNH